MKLPAGVKRTAGGTFDPTAPFTYITATNPDTHVSILDIGLLPRSILVAVNEVVGRADREKFDRLLDVPGVRIMLDSGIFALAMGHARAHNVTHDEALGMAPEDIDGFDELWEAYAKLTGQYRDRLWGVIELDQGGLENKPRTRARIEAELGFVPIPVYHPLLDGWDYYDTLAAGYDRICVGNLVQGSPGLRTRLIHTVAERARAYPYLWTHLLGVTPNNAVLTSGLRGSCDSSSFLNPIRWPGSWRGGAMVGRNIGYYPSTMWAPQDPARRGRDKLLGVTGIGALVVNANLQALSTDSHPWIAGPDTTHRTPAPR